MLNARDLRKKYFREDTEKEFSDLKARVEKIVYEHAEQGDDDCIIPDIPPYLKERCKAWLDDLGYGTNTFDEGSLLVYWNKDYLDLLDECAETNIVNAIEDHLQTLR